MIKYKIKVKYTHKYPVGYKFVSAYDNDRIIEIIDYVTLSRMENISKLGYFLNTTIEMFKNHLKQHPEDKIYIFKVKNKHSKLSEYSWDFEKSISKYLKHE